MTWSRSIRHVVRRLSRAPLFTSVAVLTLALGIGANAAIFSLVNGVLLQPLPFEDPERLVGVWHTAPGLGFDEVNQSPALHFTYREESRVFAEVGLWDNSAGALTGLDKPERIETLEVTEGTLPMLGVRPVLGRSFTAEDDSPAGAKTVLLAHAFWQTRFGGDPEILGETLTIDGEPREVIGVLPDDFRFLNAKPLAVLPFSFDRSKIDGVGNFSYQGIARLRPGATVEQANTDVERMIHVALERYPNDLSAGMFAQARFGAAVRPLMRDAIGNVGDVLWVLLGTVGLVLLIACANVANLFLVRADARSREMAIRAALGAGRLRLAREFLEESALLGVAGGVLGLLLAQGGLRLLVSMGPRSVPRLEEVSLDASVLAYTLLLSVLASLLLGLLPAFRHLRAEQTDGLKEGGRGSSDGPARRRVRAALVVGQVSLAMLLLTSSGLLLRSFQELLRVEPGFREPEQAGHFPGRHSRSVGARGRRRAADVREHAARYGGTSRNRVRGDLLLDDDGWPRQQRCRVRRGIFDPRGPAAADPQVQVDLPRLLRDDGQSGARGPRAHLGGHPRPSRRRGHLEDAGGRVLGSPERCRGQANTQRSKKHLA